ncbi:MAG: OST-HTH/LOTUS domain-containing protein, partial [Archaeoglobaceae archaeon]
MKINSAEFRSLEELIGEPEKASLSSDLAQDVESTYGRDLMIRYIRNRTEDGPVLMSQLKIDLLRLDPSFSEKKLGFSSFKSFVESLSGDVVSKIALAEKTGLPVVYLRN